MKTARTNGPQKIRHSRPRLDITHDPYRSQQKLPEPTRCPDCGAVFQAGGWRWSTVGGEAHVARCSPCQRIHDRFPAGYLTIAGAFASEHRGEILRIAHGHEVREREEHPLQRIMDITEEDNGQVITTTDTHLARGIGESLRNALGHMLEVKYGAAESVVRVSWLR